MPVFQETCEQVDRPPIRASTTEGHKDDLVARRIGAVPASVHPDESTFAEPATQATVGCEIDTKCGNM